jgi:succinate dehydrogenase / fumarate reductase flavoprotein subunit
MQGLADGYFILPYTIGDYLARVSPKDRLPADHAAFRAAENEARDRMHRLLSAGGTRSVDSFHRELGDLLWNRCGMARNRKGLEEALAKIPEIREDFSRNVRVSQEGEAFNQSLEKAGRVADFMEFAELLVKDALWRDESCGAHFREEHQTPEGEALRNDERFCKVAAWEFSGVGGEPVLHEEPLQFEYVHLAQRSYK